MRSLKYGVIIVINQNTPIKHARSFMVNQPIGRASMRSFISKLVAYMSPLHKKPKLSHSILNKWIIFLIY
uniref:Uncharacterized protein n=1 Tax=Rhizophora mucronata TaxID=61149 RepID=A0A2P2NLD2_RHIMU